LTKKWSIYFLKNPRFPETFIATVERLMTLLKDTAKSEIMAMADD